MQRSAAVRFPDEDVLNKRNIGWRIQDDNTVVIRDDVKNVTSALGAIPFIRVAKSRNPKEADLQDEGTCFD